MALRTAVAVNGITELALTKLDILTGIDTLNIATRYQVDGESLDELPSDSEVLERCTPIYEQMAGWTEDVQNCRSFTELPANAQNYIRRIETLVKARITVISVGPEREQMIVR